MFFRAASWYAIARAALPYSPLRRRDVTSATMIGVLMSATLPARLGEPARAMVALTAHRAHALDIPGAARHARVTDGPQHRGPRPAGCDHRQLHGSVPLASTKLFAFSLVPLVLLIAVLLAPVIAGAERERARGTNRRGDPRGAPSGPNGPERLPESAPRVIRSRLRSSLPGACSSWPAPCCSRRSG